MFIETDDGHWLNLDHVRRIEKGDGCFSLRGADGTVLGEVEGLDVDEDLPPLGHVISAAPGFSALDYTHGVVTAYPVIAWEISSGWRGAPPIPIFATIVDGYNKSYVFRGDYIEAPDGRVMRRDGDEWWSDRSAWAIEIEAMRASERFLARESKRDLLRQLMDLRGANEVRDVLAQVGATKLSDVPVGALTGSPNSSRRGCRSRASSRRKADKPRLVRGSVYLLERLNVALTPNPLDVVT